MCSVTQHGFSVVSQNTTTRFEFSASKSNSEYGKYWRTLEQHTFLSLSRVAYCEMFNTSNIKSEKQLKVARIVNLPIW